MADKDGFRDGKTIVLADLSPAEREAIEGLKRVLGCRTWREFARKASYLRGLMEKEKGAGWPRSKLGVEGEGVVLVLSPSLDGISQALKDKIVLNRFGIQVLGFATTTAGREISFFEDLLGLRKVVPGSG